MGGTPKGMVYHGKSENQMDDARGYWFFFWKPPKPSVVSSLSDVFLCAQHSRTEKWKDEPSDVRAPTKDPAPNKAILGGLKKTALASTPKKYTCSLNPKFGATNQSSILYVRIHGKIHHSDPFGYWDPPSKWKPPTILPAIPRHPSVSVHGVRQGWRWPANFGKPAEKSTRLY